MNSNISLAALFVAASTLIAAGCGVEPERVLVDGRPLPASDDASADEPAAADTEAEPAVARTFGIDGLGTTVYAFEVHIGDASAAPVGEPLEAAPERGVHIFILGSAPYVAPNPACQDFTTIPTEGGPCEDTVIPLLAQPLEVHGVVVLTSNTTMINGQLDAFVRDDLEARANFSVRAE